MISNIDTIGGTEVISTEIDSNNIDLTETALNTITIPTENIIGGMDTIEVIPNLEPVLVPVKAEYQEYSAYSDYLKNTMRGTSNWKLLQADEVISLDGIMNKVAEILTNNIDNNINSWIDLSKYASSVVDRVNNV